MKKTVNGLQAVLAMKKMLTEYFDKDRAYMESDLKTLSPWLKSTMSSMNRKLKHKSRWYVIMHVS